MASRRGQDARAGAPSSREEAAAALARAAEAGEVVRPVGGGTKLGWGRPPAAGAVELSTKGLDRIVEHNEGDFTAVLEAGVTLADAQRAFADAGQALSLDPPLGDGEAATIGGVVATADSGPLRHRYGAPRDLVVGMTFALSDGTLAKAGGKVIKNVAGYDLAKLFTGAFGTLGLIVDVAVRLHPKPPATATAVGAGSDPDALARAAADVAHSPLEADCLDVRWAGGAGAVLVRFAGAAAADQARAAARMLEGAGGLGDVSLDEDDDERWAGQRAAQRAAGEAVVVKVSGVQAQLANVLRAADRAGAESVVGRAAFGLSWLRLPGGAPADVAARVEELRAGLAPSPCAVLDAPEAVRVAVDPWGEQDAARLALSRRVKERFDPPAILNRGVYVGGI